MNTRWDVMMCARIGAEELSRLAALRVCRDSVVEISGEGAWVAWNAGDPELCMEMARCVVARANGDILVYREGFWYRRGGHLPVFEVPASMSDPGCSAARSAAMVVVPGAVELEMPGGDCGEPALVRLVRDDRCLSKPATAMLVRLSVVMAWADGVPSASLARSEAIWTGGSLDGGDLEEAVLWLIGREDSLPVLRGGSRFWGESVFVPMGFRVDPELPESALRRLVGAGEDELLLWRHEGCERVERVKRDQFRPMSRAGLALIRAQAAGWERPGGTGQETRGGP